MAHGFPHKKAIKCSKNGTIVGCRCDNKVNGDDRGKLQPHNGH